MDSAAIFAKRVKDLGLEARLQKLNEVGWDTYGNFAFAAGTPTAGSIPDEVFKTKITDVVFELEAGASEPPRAAALRRLWFESYTITVGEMRRRMERTDEDPPRKLPQVEKETRKDMLRKRLGTAVILEGELEPANSLIDRLVQQVEDGHLEYVAWEDCPKRDQELSHGRSKKRWSVDSTKTVREVEYKEEPKADTTSGLKLSWALQRRGLAMEIAGLLQFETHEKIRSKFLDSPSRDSPDPRYASASLDQIRAADREVWRLLQRKCRLNFRPSTCGEDTILDHCMDEILNSMEVNLILLPLPSLDFGNHGKKRKASPAPDRGGSKRASSSNESAELQRLRNQVAALQGKGKGKSSGGKSKGKERGSRGGSRSNLPVPNRLSGGVAVTKSGERICFGFNLKECNSAKPGGTCNRGKHVCCNPGCEGLHPKLECSD